MHLSLIAELIGTVAFALSGAMLGVKKDMDIFGVTVMGFVTAVGGGIIRDLILGVTPPAAFRSPLQSLVALGTITLLQIALFVYRPLWERLDFSIRHSMLFHMIDAVGLAVFAIVGAQAAFDVGYSGGIFLPVFVGTLTAVGGGILRDMMADEPPSVLYKRVYAVAALLGALLYVLLMRVLPPVSAALISSAAVLLIRFLAVYFRWNLPVPKRAHGIPLPRKKPEDPEKK